MHLNTWHRKQSGNSINKLLRSAHGRIMQTLTMIFTYPTVCSSLSSDMQIKTNATEAALPRNDCRGRWVGGAAFPTLWLGFKVEKDGGISGYLSLFFPFVFAQAWVSLFYQDTAGIGGRRLHVGWLWLWSVSKDGHHQFLHSLYMLFYSWGGIYLPSPWTWAGLVTCLAPKNASDVKLCQFWARVRSLPTSAYFCFHQRKTATML